jgi:tRNA pseudouridine38/39 synthase
VEGVLFAALAKARLVDPEGGLEGCGWERCGRTDRGVSAAGQVVSLYARSSHRRSAPSPKTSSEEGGVTAPDVAAADASGGGASLSDAAPRASSLDTLAPPPAGEGTEVSASTTMTTTTATTTARDVRYLRTLNGILPPSIRVYAWAPVAPSFSARFSCRARHYKYFFSARNLDVEAMRNGAGRLVGEHDFRNLCKLDPAKQLTSFRRRILRADVSPLLDDDDGMHVLDLVGTAFLYNQVRHIMAVLLLIGARLESPSVISALLNADPNREEKHNDNSSSSNRSGGALTAPEEEAPPPLVTCKPEYQMADALPLVLWDCVYAEEDAPWRTDDAGSEGGSIGLHTQMAGLAERAQVEATLAEHFLAAASQFHARAPVLLRPPAAGEGGGWDVPLGGGMMRREGRYVGLLKRKRLESVDVVNARYRDRKRESRVVDDTG